MTSLLDRAFTSETPGDPLPPGPRTNDWRRAGAMPAAASSREADLLDELWRPRGRHRRADGSPGSVPCRLVPSAGGAYPVQWHVAVPAGCGSALLPGSYVRDEDGTLCRRPGPPPGGRHVALVVTVQPGRSFGRYRHRAWPLWVADAAYALEAVRALVPAARLPRGWSSLGLARELLGLPHASQTGWWLDHGLAPELCLARIELPGAWQVDQAVAVRLGGRRSPDLADFARRAEDDRRPPRRVREVALHSGQHWVLGADRVLAWRRPTPATDRTAYARIWQVHRRAARLCYRFAGQGLGVRPVSGFTSEPKTARPLLHALAVLDLQERSA